MQQVTKSEFFSRVGPLDVVVGCEYYRGRPEGITSTFKTRGGTVIGVITGQLFHIPTVYFLA